MNRSAFVGVMAWCLTRDKSLVRVRKFYLSSVITWTNEDPLLWCINQQPHWVKYEICDKEIQTASDEMLRVSVRNCVANCCTVIYQTECLLRSNSIAWKCKLIIGLIFRIFPGAEMNELRPRLIVYCRKKNILKLISCLKSLIRFKFDLDIFLRTS